MDTINVRVSTETKRQIEAIAAQKGRTVSEHVREVLLDEVRNKEIHERLDMQEKFLTWILGYSISGSIALEEFIKQPKEVNGKELNSPELAKQLKERVATRMSGMAKNIREVIMGKDNSDE